jgi:putative ABC transport system ATP-binding protein
MNLVGLDERMDHRPEQLSGGEQQRVAIARALVTEPAIALADEPTGNLDRKAGKQVLILLREACKVKGQTIVMVTHDPYAASFADRVVFLRDGEMVHELQNGSNKISPQVILDVLSELEI